MHLIEIRQDLQDTSVKTVIYDNSKILRQLETLVEFTTDLSQADCEYIATGKVNIKLIKKLKIKLMKKFNIDLVKYQI